MIIAFHFRMREQRVKVVNFDVGKAFKINWLPATSLGLLQNLWQFYNPHIYIYQCWILVKISPVVLEIFGGICWFLPYRLKSTNFSYLNLRRYWTKVRAICTQCKRIIGAIKLLIHCDIPIRFKMAGCRMKFGLPILSKLVAMAMSQCPMRNRKYWSRLLR